MAGISATISKKVSIVFNLIDDYYKIPINQARVYIDGLRDKPINKNDGSFVFINLEKREYIFRIEALNYLPVVKQIDLIAYGQNPPVINIYMKHAVDSVKIKGCKIIWGKLLNAQGNALPEKNFKISIMSANINFRLLRQVESGSRQVKLFAAMKNQMEGQMLLLKAEARQDYFMIEKFNHGEEVYLLERDIPYAIGEGTILYPAWELMTNGRGEFILPLRQAYLPENNKLMLLLDMENKFTEPELYEIKENDIKAEFKIS